ncbi:MotA/TolQ/ExbB proton channel family protein [candidate division KSB1 bacterium]|nr:MotA/TolQ/ExbB proton channel family protein [candidate division KSB1 bacterium]
MSDFFFDGGSIMWLMLLLGVAIISMTAQAIIALSKNELPQMEKALNAILFWGCISAGLGIFGHFTGIFIAMQNILKAGDTSPMIVAQGYIMSFVDIIAGLTLFIVAAILWLILRWRFKVLSV